jgi:predicted ATPase/transcriptional regulator with XRE-family HTH domain/Flp pilus assembly protein TadD
LLRRHRIDAGLSQERLAERARMSTQGIGALERGDRRTPQRETLMLLIEALELDPEQRAAFEAAAFRQSVPRLDRAQVVPWPHVSASGAELPVSLTSFIGREVEVDEICALVVEHRLITLTGPGGIGKTRTVLDASRALFEAYPDAVRFVELAAVRDALRVVDAVLAIFNLGATQSRSAFDTLVAHLQQRRILLVIDNCEHVIAEVARVVDLLLRACPQLKILATSREPLRVSGERIYRLPSLRMPTPEEMPLLSAAQASAFPAIRLFAERAFAADRTFTLDDERARTVAEICAHLDGIPLAIELAAARVSSLSLPALASNLRRQFPLLGGGPRTADSRQRTMRGAIDWSFDLLDESEQRLFANLAIFAGGWTLDAAVAVVGASEDPDLEHSRIVELLSSLVDKSLVIADLGLVTPRYRMLEPFRQYAREKLVERGELDRVSQRHAAAFLRIAEDFSQAVALDPERDEYAIARADIDNWRAALEWCLSARNDVAMGQLILSKLRMFWGTYAAMEGLRWTRLALAAGDSQTPPAIAAVLERTDALLSWKLGESEAALAAATRALAHQSTLGDELETARAELEVGNGLLRVGRAGEAVSRLREALAKAQKHNSGKLAAKILYLIAEACAANGEFSQARDACAEAFALFPDAKGDRLMVSLIVRSEIEFQAGDAETALRITTEALGQVSTLRKSENAEVHEATLSANAAVYLVSLERFDEARTYARAALAIASRLQFPSEQIWALQHLAAISIFGPHEGDGRYLEAVERTALLIGFIVKRYGDLRAALGPTERQEFDRILAALRIALPADRLAVLQERGAMFSDEEAIAEAMRV